MEQYHLSNETIDLLSAELGRVYTENGCSRRDMLSAKLLLEESLLKYQAAFGADTALDVRIYRILGMTRVSIRISSPELDPFTSDENSAESIVRSVSSVIETGRPSWRFRRGANEIVFSVAKKKRIGNLSKLGIAVASALLVGILARLIFDGEALSTFVKAYLDPIADAYSGMFCVMAVLLTFLATVLSIVHIGDLTALGTISKRLMLRFTLIPLAIIVLFVTPMLPFFNLSGSGHISFATKTIYDILIDFIPTNLISPFLNFNSVQLMVVGAMFGFSLIVMGQRGETLLHLFDECNLVAVYTNEFLNRFIAIFVSLKVFSIITTSDFSKLAGAGKAVAAILLAELIMMAIGLVLLRVGTQTSPRKALKMLVPTMMITLSSANFGAGFSTMIDSILRFGVNDDTAGIVLNIGGVFFKPAFTLSFILSSLFMAAEYEVDISIAWVLVCVLLSIILGATMPNAPGASVAVIGLLFPSLGLPAEAVSLMVAIFAVLQFPTVAVDTWCLQCETMLTRDFELNVNVQ